MKRFTLALFICSLLTACAPGAGGTRYYAKLHVWEEQGAGEKRTAAPSDLKVDICFKVDEKSEPICHKNVGSDALLRIPTKSQRLALYSVTLLGEKPYGDKNFYYAWQPDQLAWISLTQPARHVYVGTLVLGVGERKGDAYPSMGISVYCNPKLLRAIEEKEKESVVKRCFNIGSVTLSERGESHTTMRGMPPKPMYRPFGRDPDVPYGEIPEGMKTYH